MSLGGGGGQGHLTPWAAASCWVQMPVLTDHPAVRIPAGTGSAPVSHVQIIRAGGLSPGFTSEAAGPMGGLAPRTAPAAASQATSVALRGQVTHPRGGRLRDLPCAPGFPARCYYEKKGSGAVEMPSAAHRAAEQVLPEALLSPHPLSGGR